MTVIKSFESSAFSLLTYLRAGTHLDLENLVLELAFMIDDPCGVDAIELARALVELGRTVPEKHRKTIAGLCRIWARSFAEGDTY